MFLFFSSDNNIKSGGLAIVILIFFSCLFCSCSYDEFMPDYNNPNDPTLSIYIPNPPQIYGFDYRSVIYSNQTYLVWERHSRFEDGFIIERSDSVINKFIETGRAAAGSTSYRDYYNFRMGVTYYYRIRAYKGNNISAPSAIVKRINWW